MSTASPDAKKKEFNDVIQNALKRAAGGGVSGAAAMVLQVTSLMWLRTTMNYQYRHRTPGTLATMKTLYKEGGVRRFYRGYLPALAQGPLSRFGDTAANAGVLALMDGLESTRDLPIGAKTLCASATAAAWRIFLMPIDTTKTIMQVEGARGFPALMGKIRTSGPTVLFHGALAASGASLVGHYPWFFTYNYLDEKLPHPDTPLQKLGRRAAIGFFASLVSDTTSNSIRVIKTTKQTHTQSISYPDAVRLVVREDGIAGLFGRGLKTRLMANGLQGLLFSVLWKYIDELMFGGGAARK
mmetsp:Transcript_31177/g.101545  ORF Transcript_31177/g.101545 Transcript_31177/m.101545 type:complete len:298 (-) Transcript_31177:120-1013(-)|eukprot:CAMPEP_0196780250 /NCGR_PEP_ID=MMETSP1104-20130614/7358_1 /TAXON_ID=33652 /ORGANISM="Cafeteria sp., Strain Caron Lab Isolate" /LENGTH=297 /DNA_ID=CAMNT_0042150447 /DNA_START=58 /DNA_END=951 /DNA_ORIENTATION=+